MRLRMQRPFLTIETSKKPNFRDFAFGGVWRGGKSNDLTAIRLVIASARNMGTSVPRLGVTRRKQPNLPNTSIYYHATQLHRLGNGAIWETLQVLFPFRGGGNFKYCEQAS